MLQQDPPVLIVQIASTIGTSRSQLYRIKKFLDI
ncbi:hypothetical protein ACWM0Y_14580 [Lactiplantibacillus plantarum]